MSPGAFDEGDVVIEMDLLPPRWVDIQDEVTDTLKKITEKSADLDKLHSKHVLPGFDDDKVKKQEEAMIEDLTRDITRAFHECKKSIGRIDIMVKDSKASGGVSKGDEIMAKNIQISLASKVQEVSSVFRKKQSNYLKKLRALEGMNSPMDRSFTPQNPYTDPSMLDSEADKSFAQTALQQSAQKMLQSNETTIAQREREINDIARGITELAEIFKDLQMMVIDQGTVLDSVAYNIEKMSVDVKEAEKELNVVSFVSSWTSTSTLTCIGWRLSEEDY